MKDRINKIIKHERISPSRFADDIGVQRSSVSHILSGRNNASLDVVQKILHAYPALNADWLLFGKGEMYRYKKEHQQSLFGEDDNPQQTANSGIKQEPVQNTPNPLAQSSGNIHNSQVLNQALAQSFSTSKNIEKIVIFYSDKTFVVYNLGDS